MIVTFSAEGEHGPVILGTFHVPNDQRIVIERQECSYPAPSQWQTTGCSDIQELPPPVWEAK